MSEIKTKLEDITIQVDEVLKEKTKQKRKEPLSNFSNKNNIIKDSD